MSKIKWEVPKLISLSSRVDGVADCDSGSSAEVGCYYGHNAETCNAGSGD